MKLNCSIAEDLLPLYLEDMCSEETKAALEEHLRDCPACREKAERMRDSGVIPETGERETDFSIPDYAKKIKRHRLRVGIAVALISALAACLLALLGLTVIDMHRTANPTVPEVEEGVYNLTARELETTAEDVGGYVLYTNYETIKVTVRGSGDIQGSVMLWATDIPDSFIRIGKVDEEASTVTFNGCTSARRYRITCEGLPGAVLTVSDGRVVSFWKSLLNVLDGIIG